MTRRGHIKAPVGGAGRSAGSRSERDFFSMIDMPAKVVNFAQLPDFRSRLVFVCGDIGTSYDLYVRVAGNMFPGRSLDSLCESEIRRIESDGENYL